MCFRESRLLRCFRVNASFFMQNIEPHQEAGDTEEAKQVTGLGIKGA